LAANDMPPSIARDVDLREGTAFKRIEEALDTLINGGNRVIRVIGQGMDRIDFVEVTLSERPLRRAMLAFSRNILLLSLAISGITALLVYVSLHLLIVRPVRRLSENVAAFAADPENATRIIEPSTRRDEIGVAEAAVASMQRALAGELRQKKHLADVGLAVSKINHDLRNMLSSAQIMSDRLASTGDPTTQRIVPKLIGALDRAIGFSQSILDYGKAGEREPRRRLVPLSPLIDEIEAGLGLGRDGSIALHRDLAEGIVVDADPDQLFRALLNITRNAAEALRDTAAPERPGRIDVSARRVNGAVVIVIADNGPGIPAAARAKLFQPFEGSASPGGTGLGLAIAAEILRLHGGDIRLEPSASGARFRLELPDRA
jgi:signal transduction histidine kinase